MNFSGKAWYIPVGSGNNRSLERSLENAGFQVVSKGDHWKVVPPEGWQAQSGKEVKQLPQPIPAPVGMGFSESNMIITDATGKPRFECHELLEEDWASEDELWTKVL